MRSVEKLFSVSTVHHSSTLLKWVLNARDSQVWRIRGCWASGSQAWDRDRWYTWREDTRTLRWRTPRKTSLSRHQSGLCNQPLVQLLIHGYTEGFSSFPSPSLPPQHVPLPPARGFGERFKLPVGLHQSPAIKSNLVHFEVKNRWHSDIECRISCSWCRICRISRSRWWISCTWGGGSDRWAAESQIL